MISVDEYFLLIDKSPSPETGRWNSSARLQLLCQFFSQFLGRSEHTWRTEAQYSVDSSGICTQDLLHLRASGWRSNQLSYLLLLCVA